VNERVPHTIHIIFPSAMLAEGFWLYVWRVKTCDDQVLLYVGRTGDSSSANAAPPYRRIAQHLGTVAASNMLRTHLEKGRGIKPEDCISFEFIGHGPLFARQADLDSHKPIRDIVAAQEAKLALALGAAGYDVMNTVRTSKPLDGELWGRVRAAFAEDFPGLAEG
jgi:hypothetical protein